MISPVLLMSARASSAFVVRILTDSQSKISRSSRHGFEALRIDRHVNAPSPINRMPYVRWCQRFKREIAYRQ